MDHPKLVSAPARPAEPSFRLTFRRAMLLAAASALLIFFRDVWLTAFFAVLLADLLSFPVNFFRRFLPRGAATLLTLFLGIGLLGVLAPLAVNPLVDQFQQAEGKMSEALGKAKVWLRHQQAIGPQGTSQGLPSQAIAKGVERKTEGLTDTLVGAAGKALVKVTSFGSLVVVLVVLSLFFVHEPSSYRLWARALVPREHEAEFDHLWQRLGEGLRRWIRGILISMTIMGVVTAGGLKLAGVQDWLLLGCLTFFGTFVPYVGAISSAVPGLLVALAQSEQKFLLACLVYLGVHIMEGYVVQPLIMKKAVTIQPAILLLWQITMGLAFGLLGVVVATPLYICVKIAVDTLYVERSLGKEPFPKIPDGSGSEKAEARAS
jgi:predicted PurR-regulated permease PerM